MRLISNQTLARVAGCLLMLGGCAASDVADSGGDVADSGATDTGEPAASEGAWRSTGFEIVDGQGGIAWMAVEMTEAEFAALELPTGWISNPRDLDASFGEFLRSPDQTEEGVFDELDLLGHQWRHVATLSDRGQPVGDDGLLTRTTVDKHHRLTYEAGRTMTTLTSPEGETYLRITRDPARTQDVPTLPEGWRLDAVTPTERTVVVLPNPTTLLRTDNEDAFQGPVDLEEGGR